MLLQSSQIIGRSLSAATATVRDDKIFSSHNIVDDSAVSNNNIVDDSIINITSHHINSVLYIPAFLQAYQINNLVSRQYSYCVVYSLPLEFQYFLR